MPTTERVDEWPRGHYGEVSAHIRSGRPVRRYTRRTAKALGDYLRAVQHDIEERETYGYGPVITVDSDEARYYIGRARDRAYDELRQAAASGDTSAAEALLEAPRLAERVRGLVATRHAEERRRRIEEVSRATAARVQESRRANRMLNEYTSQHPHAIQILSTPSGELFEVGQRSETQWSRARHRRR